MKIEDQETLNEIFLGKEDPDMAFKKPMTNNLKEIEDILDFTITYRFYDEVPNIQGKLLEFRGKMTEEEPKVFTKSEVDRLIREAREREAYWSLANLELIKGGTFNEGMVYKNQLDRLKVISEELSKQEEGSK